MDAGNSEKTMQRSRSRAPLRQAAPTVSSPAKFFQKQQQLFANGFICKDPKQVKAEDFFFSGLNQPGNTTNNLGSKVTAVNVAQIPGLNTLGISMARIDFELNRLNPPHTHPRATEILTVLEGSLYVGFVTSNPDNKLFAKVQVQPKYRLC